MVYSSVDTPKSATQRSLAVVVPTYGETALLAETVETMPECVDHIVVVDDGSPPPTFECARALAAADSRIDVVRLGFNYGVGRAICRGYEAALAAGADVVAVMAADNQMDPGDLQRVVQPVVDGRADYVKGNRLAHPDSHHMPVVRRMGTRILAKLTAAVGGLAELDDAQCGYTAISARALRHVPLDELYPRYGYPNDLILRLRELGARIEQPPVRPVYQNEESGLRIWAVVLPIGGILVRGGLRRVRNRLAGHKKLLAA